MQNFIKYDSQRPNINCIGIIMETCLFWSYVLFSACYCLHDNFLCTQPKISNFNNWNRFTSNVFSFKENILWLEITMRDTMIMELLHAFTYLVNNFKSILFIHFIIYACIQGIPKSSYFVPQRTTFAVLCDVPNACGTFNDVKYFEYILILNPSQLLIYRFFFLYILFLSQISIYPTDCQIALRLWYKYSVDLFYYAFTCAKLPSPISSALLTSNYLLKKLEVTSIFCISYFEFIIWLQV